MPLSPGVQVEGRYDVIGLVASGGFATVWKVRHRVLGSVHALKVLRWSTAVARSRLLEEGREQARLEHPNIVRVTDVVEVDGEIGLVMEFVEGPTLASRLAERGPPPLEEALSIGVGILQGVDAAHRAGLIHRDLKPANILLSGHGDTLVPRITDFGLVRRLDATSGLTPDHMGMGTPGYMAPEQYSGASQVDRRADIFSLGAILYELLTGASPFGSGTPHELYNRAQKRNFEPLDQKIPGLPQGITAAVHGALSPYPQARPESCAELLALWVGEPGSRLQPALTVSLPSLSRTVDSKVVHVVCADEDRIVVRHKVAQMRSLGFEVYFDESANGRQELDLEEVQALHAALEVWVFWSKAARRSDLVGHVLRLLHDAGTEGAPSPLAGRVVTVPLDRTVIPAELPPPRAGLLAGDRPLEAVAVSALTLIGLCGALTLVAVGLNRGEQALLWWVLTLGLLGFGLALLVGQTLGRPDRIFQAGVVFQAGLWMERASVRELLDLSDRVLTTIYGQRPLSVRALLVSILIGTLPLGSLALAWGFGLGASSDVGGAQKAAWEGASLSLAITLPLGLANMVFDFGSLLFTRRIVGKLLERPGWGVLIAGLGLDLWVTGLAALCPVILAALNRGWQTEVWSYTGAVLGHLGLLIAGDLRLSSLHRAFFPAEFTLVALSIITGCFPSMVHGVLLGAAGINRLLGRLPTRVLGAALRRAADRPAGPGEAVLFLGLAFAAALSVPQWVPAAPRPERWVAIPASACAEGCTIGSAAAEPGRDQEHQDEPLREVFLATSFEVQDTELTQERWVNIWDRASQIVPDRYGLPRTPSFYRGRNMPIEGVSWCEAARFANLWSAVEGRTLAYCSGAGCTESSSTPLDARHGLQGCELRQPVYWRMGADGYRLLTDVEWEVAARACQPDGACIHTRFWTGDNTEGLLMTDWVLQNGGFRPHPVATPPTSLGTSHPLGLFDLQGNVREWVWDNYTESPLGGLLHHLDHSDRARVYRGANWLQDIDHASAANREGTWPNDRVDLQGVRLARSRPNLEGP